jgi:hypothetical protein
MVEELLAYYRERVNRSLEQQIISGLGIPKSMVSAEDGNYSSSFASLREFQRRSQDLADAVALSFQRCMFPRYALGDLEIVECALMADRVQVRFPRTKKKRIRRKWAKQEKNYRSVPWQKAYRVGGTLYMHPQSAARLRRAVDSGEVTDVSVGEDRRTRQRPSFLDELPNVLPPLPEQEESFLTTRYYADRGMPVLKPQCLVRDLT